MDLQNGFPVTDAKADAERLAMQELKEVKQTWVH
jgi:hypothetical protein